MSGENLAGNAEQETSDDAVISMVDYLKEEENLVEDANAVLGDSDENHCTYGKGYVGRQALYACSTCETKDKGPAGVCLACSYACHEGHDLYELYTKRNFRCDCGNSKFSDIKCKLQSDKEEHNIKNQYNQNFKGLYCVCERPYPDPEDEIEDEMIQCIVCEDWYHGRHLGDCKPPSNFQEMICRGCMSKHEFLWAYNVHSKEIQALKSDSSTSEVTVDTSNSDVSVDTAVKSENSDSSVNGSSEVKDKECVDTKPDNCDSKCDTGASDTEQCLLEDLNAREVTVKESATFWPEGFRSKLCVCTACKAMYKDQDIEFIVDESDSVLAYEKRGKDKRSPSSEADQEKRVLEGMDRVQQIEMVQGFNDMKSALSDYLKKFAENGKVVRAEDIREFFSQMEQRKRQKTDHTPAHFCR
ncbi:putative E3 ubiquitin-protein ligase UBR7 [Ruditapes philippinarum]|uniref:putative E3 ubiquitin-protein ligase UBR7 n=1 Tax=Ruditapes philippinarum TaxID=129788 RepID=UPI00295AE725|nr:putative E3 ubiquitin-protein ligase UBR7 [Ruditapes philippinarum]